MTNEGLEVARALRIRRLSYIFVQKFVRFQSKTINMQDKHTGILGTKLQFVTKGKKHEESESGRRSVVQRRGRFN